VAWAVAPQWIVDFAEGSKEMRDVLGGKGANVAEMTRVLGPEGVPAGFALARVSPWSVLSVSSTLPW
jgi:pyruvate,orthophosphate dikinase